MSNPTVEQMQEVIAIYDGCEKMTHDCEIVFRKNGYLYPKSFFKYESDWSLLMPVIEKIIKTPLIENDGTPCKDPQDVCYPRTWGMPTEDGKQVMVRFNGHACHQGDTLIEAAFLAVYEFIDIDNYRKKQS
jgi:hypothetical protein